MPYLGTLTPEEAEAMGVPRSVRVISPAYANRSKASTNSKNLHSSNGSETLENLPTSAESASAQQDPMAPAAAYENQGREIAMATLPIDLVEYIRALTYARLRRFHNETRQCQMMQIVRKDKVRIEVEVPEEMVLAYRMQRYVEAMKEVEIYALQYQQPQKVV